MNAKYRVLRISPLFWIVISLAISVAYASDFATKHDSPISNASACGDCHQAPQLGGSSPTTVTRVGHLVGKRYVPGPNGGLVHTRFANKDESQIPVAQNIRGLRVSLNLLGDGYIEAIPDEEFLAVAAQQRQMTNGIVHGEPSEAIVLESGTKARRIGRFGWKGQHATLVSASADALHNELGTPNYLYKDALLPNSGIRGALKEALLNLSTTNTIAADAELQDLVRFIRSSEPLAQDADLAKTIAVMEGQQVFEKIGCSLCHVSSFQTSPAGTVINGGTYTIPAQLGSKTVHPYSDYLLHDIGTGDGIVQTADPADIDRSAAQRAANKFRTAPLWGIRYRKWLMHDGQSTTYNEAIARHSKEAFAVAQKYRHLTSTEQQQLQSFLDSL
jgi:CxxC motif-containing protein (DUF1111 family)